jgi:hypothetical protein
MNDDVMHQPDRAQEPVNTADLPNCYLLILSQAETDLSDMTLVDNIPTFDIAPRLHGPKPIPAARILRAADLKKQKDCPLCHADDQAHSAAWHAYGVEKDVTGAVAAAQDAGVEGVTPAVVRKHFPNHNYAQPSPNKRISAEEQLYLAEGLTDREKKILLAVGRMRVMKAKQIIDLLFTPETATDASAQKSAYRTLHKLRYMHMLYQYRTRTKRSPEVYYFLGKHAVPFVEREDGILQGQKCVSKITDINEWLLNHDTTAVEVFIQLRKQLYNNRGTHNMVDVAGQKMDLNLPSDAWWGARSLIFGFTNPFNALEQKATPDGFAALTFNDGRHRQFRLPFFYEWDSGSKEMEDTVEQMVNYVALAMSGAVGQRFPQLAVPGYCPPVLLVTKSPYRAQKLAQMIREACSKFAPEAVPAMFVTDMETLQNAAYAPGAWRSVHADNPTEAISIAEHLLNASEKLCSTQPLHWRVPMTIDPAAAKFKLKPAGFAARKPAADAT